MDALDASSALRAAIDRPYDLLDSSFAPTAAQLTAHGNNPSSVGASALVGPWETSVKAAFASLFSTEDAVRQVRRAPQLRAGRRWVAAATHARSEHTRHLPASPPTRRCHA